MTLGRTIRIFPPGCRLAALAAASLLSASCLAQVETVPIRFSKPFEPILSTNLNALVGPQQKSFQELLKETDSHGVSGIFRDDTPFGTMPAPARPRLSPAAAQKYREAAEKQKNWAFTIESDVENDPQIGQLLKFLDADAQAEDARQRSVYEKFYERLEREDKGESLGGAYDPLNPSQKNSDTLAPLTGSEPNAFGAVNLPGRDATLASLPGSPALGEARKLTDAKPRDLLGAAARRDVLSTTSTRQATDFKEYQQGSLAGGLSTPSQQARFDAFKNLFESKPSAGVAAAAAASKSSSPLSTALGNLGLPSASSGAGSAAASRGSFVERFDVTPGWKPSPPVSSPLPPVGSAFPSTPSRGSTLFPTVPTRRP